MPVREGFQDVDLTLQVLEQLCRELLSPDSLDGNMFVSFLTECEYIRKRNGCAGWLVPHDSL